MGTRSLVAGFLLVASAAMTAACGSSDSRTGFDPGTAPPEGDAGETTTAADGGTVTPPAKPDQPGCAQDAYTETLPTSASLSGIAFSPPKANEYLLGALGLRYPIGKALVEGGLASKLAQSQGNCIDRFLGNKSSATVVLRQAATVVHECGHFYDLGEGSGGASAYVIRPDLTFTCNAGDTLTRGGKTFARSLLRGDSYYPSRKACPGGSSQNCDIYAEVYLDGSSTDDAFDSGDQGYNSVLEEATQYVNSLATALAFKDQYAGARVSERDGILTFLWYIERYLAMARTEFPAAYKLLSEDECWRQATLSVWDRGWFYLRATKDLTNLGIEDAKIEPLVNDPALVAEIDTLRKLECK